MLPSRDTMLVGVLFPEHVGTTVVRRVALATALGPSAYAVWTHLVELRDTSRSGQAHGAVFVGMAGIVRMLASRNGARPGVGAVKRALEKLRGVGLLEVLGWLPNTRGVFVYWRRAVGLCRPTLDAALIPPAALRPLAAEWERATRAGYGTRGGKRTGAGRKAGASQRRTDPMTHATQPPENDPAPTPPDPLAAALERARLRRVAAGLGQTIKRPNLQSNDPTSVESNGPRSLLSLSLSSGSEIPTESPAGGAPGGRGDLSPRAELPPATPTAYPRGHREHAFTPGTVTPYRSLSQARLVVRVPQAPYLDPADTPERHAALIRDWYVGACAAIFPRDKKTTWAVKGKPTQRTKHHARFVALAKACLALDVRPAAWMHHCVSQWRHMGNDKAPPVMAVCSVKKIEAEGKSYDEDGRACARDRYTASALEHMMREQYASHGIKPYPEDERRAALDAIRVEVEEGQAKVNADVKHGIWVWT